MDRSEINAVLNRLLHVLRRSLPAYLAEAKPWGRSNDRPIQEALSRVIDDQQDLAMRVTREICRRNGRPDPGRFPIEFTAMNDVAIDFLLPELIQRQSNDVAAIEQCAADLAEVPQVRSLAEETLGNAKGHLDTMEEMMNAE